MCQLAVGKRAKKTTAASATALFLLNKLKINDSILLFSTDPAHSLSDSLDTEIGNRLVEVSQLRGARLFAYEMDASLALERFRAEHGKVLAEIAERLAELLLDDFAENEDAVDRRPILGLLASVIRAT